MKTAIKDASARILVKKNKNSPAIEEDFDAVKTMRAIRDEISKEIMNMTFEEENAYLQKLLAKKAK